MNLFSNSFFFIHVSIQYEVNGYEKLLVICSAYLIALIFVPILKLSLLFLLDIEEVRSRWFTEAAVALTEKGKYSRSSR